MSPHQASAVILAALDGASLSAEEKACFQKLPPAGFTLFRRNLAPAYDTVRQLHAELQDLAVAEAGALILAIDQEGGRVARLRSPFPNQGPALQLASGSAEPEALTDLSNYGYIVGCSLRGLGINVNFAPVVDILSRDDNHAIGDRCFGRDARSVSLRAGAFLRGMQAAGVYGCLKHFPGQGHAALDTHESGAKIELAAEQLLERELVPFSQLLHECPLIMISHAVYPALDPVLPASLSPQIMEGLLRGRLQYQGLIVSDDMNMKAIDQAREPWSEAIVASVAAGADLVLVCRELERFRWATEALTREAQRSTVFAERLATAAQRVRRLQTRLSQRS